MLCILLNRGLRKCFEDYKRRKSGLGKGEKQPRAMANKTDNIRDLLLAVRLAKHHQLGLSLHDAPLPHHAYWGGASPHGHRRSIPAVCSNRPTWIRIGISFQDPSLPGAVMRAGPKPGLPALAIFRKLRFITKGCKVAALGERKWFADPSEVQTRRQVLYIPIRLSMQYRPSTCR